MTNILTLKITKDRGIKLDRNLMNCLLALRQLARNCELDFVVETGESISPITVSGDLDLQKAELIKQEALRIAADYI